MPLQMNKTEWKPPLWLIVVCGCLLVLLSFGPRSTLGFFQGHMLQDRDWAFTVFGAAMALQNLAWGIGQPIFGAIADRFGAWRVLAIGGALYAIGLYTMAHTTTPFWLFIGSGLFVGLGVSAGSFGIVLSVFARHVKAENRSFVFGLGTAAGSAGMFLFSPLSLYFITQYGWSHSLVIFSAFMLVIPVLAIPLYGNAENAPHKVEEFKQTVGEALKEALGHKSYLLLTAGFFVCGFQVAFITTHFPLYITEIGIDLSYAGYAMSLIGFFNILGCLASGSIGQTYSKPKFLTLIYIARSIAISGFLLLPQTPHSVIIFSIVMGLLWLSTVPPTNGLVAVMFGTRHLGLLGGIVFFSHQIGSFCGIFFGSILHQVTGSFDITWWFAVALGLFAALMHYPIVEKPAKRDISDIFT